MFGFRKLRPPLTTFQRVDIELLMRRSIHVLGEDWVRRCPIVTSLDELSLDESGPQQRLDTASAALLDRLPAMPVHPQVELRIGEMEELGDAAVYQAADEGDVAKIVIAREVLADPLRTLMELAYQYATHFWHHVDAPSALDRDPRTTNLLPVCCGLGILASDASLYDQQWSQAGYAGWSISRSGYYTAVEIGYAMALLARLRREENPVWIDRLRLDSQVTAKNAWRYFSEQERFGRSLLFDAERIPGAGCDMRQLADWLAGEDPAFALAAAHALCKHDNLSVQAVESAIQASCSGDRDLVPVAAKLLGRSRELTPAIQQRIHSLLGDSHPPTVLAAIESAQSLGLSLTRYRSRIAKLLDHCAEDPFLLLKVIGQQGHDLAAMAPQVCTHLERAIRKSDDEIASALVECLLDIAVAPRQAIERRIRSKSIREDAFQRLDAAN